jgi:hypothetical protein
VSRNADLGASDPLRFVVSQGKDGKPPTGSLRAFPQSGYVVIRDRWPEGPADYEDCSYLAQICAFHSRTHKHADDLSFVWYDRGVELVTDSGRFGYVHGAEQDSKLAEEGFWYSHPSRVYVESTRAHNTVEIDQRSFPRKGVRPYGSALLRWGRQDGVYFTESHVRHWRSLRHARMLIFNPGEWLIVFDWLWDNVKEPHSFTQRLHFAPELDADRFDHRVRLNLPRGSAQLFVAPLLPTPLRDCVHGQEQPELLGWISRREREMTPRWTIAYGVEGVPHHTFATLLTFGDDAPKPLHTESRSAVSGRKARLCWDLAGSVHSVEFSRPQEGDISLAYRIS